MSGEAPGPDPLTEDAYRDLFREAELPAPVDTPESRAETGRLFRTSRAQTDTEAIVAIRPEQARKFRSLTVAAVEPDPVSEPAPSAPETPRVARASISVDEEDRPRRRAPGLRPGAVYLIDIGLVVLVALIEVFLTSQIGWITGIALVVAAGYTAWVVRLSDWVVAAIAPPIAFFVAAITAGQIGLGGAGGGLLNRIAQVFFILGTNWFWILAAIALAFVLTTLRRRKRP
jgi:hypothetical protein